MIIVIRSRATIRLIMKCSLMSQLTSLASIYNLLVLQTCGVNSAKLKGSLLSRWCYLLSSFIAPQIIDIHFLPDNRRCTNCSCTLFVSYHGLQAIYILQASITLCFSPLQNKLVIVLIIIDYLRNENFFTFLFGATIFLYVGSLVLLKLILVCYIFIFTFQMTAKRLNSCTCYDVKFLKLEFFFRTACTSDVKGHHITH